MKTLSLRTLVAGVCVCATGGLMSTGSPLLAADPFFTETSQYSPRPLQDNRSAWQNQDARYSRQQADGHGRRMNPDAYQNTGIVPPHMRNGEMTSGYGEAQQHRVVGAGFSDRRGGQAWGDYRNQDASLSPSSRPDRSSRPGSSNRYGGADTWLLTNSVDPGAQPVYPNDGTPCSGGRCGTCPNGECSNGQDRHCANGECTLCPNGQCAQCADGRCLCCPNGECLGENCPLSTDRLSQGRFSPVGYGRQIPVAVGTRDLLYGNQDPYRSQSQPQYRPAGQYRY